MTELRICQLASWDPAGPGAAIHCQNYFIQQDFLFQGTTYQFVPFQASGSLMTLTGDSEVLTLLFPAEDMIVRLVEQGDGNRNSTLTLTNVWLNSNDQPVPGSYPEYYIGQGASFSETTVELRFRSTMDAVNAQIPYRRLSSENVGILPLDSNIRLS